LNQLGHSVLLEIVAFFAILPGERGEFLQRSSQWVADSSPAAQNTDVNEGKVPRARERSPAHAARSRSKK
jgi:hypothetical protein